MLVLFTVLVQLCQQLEAQEHQHLLKNNFPVSQLCLRMPVYSLDLPEMYQRVQFSQEFTLIVNQQPPNVNNSLIGIDKEDDGVAERLRAEESRVVRIIEAFDAVSLTKEWKILKTEIFDNLVNTLERNIQTEAKKESIDSQKLNRLAGELHWAEKYADLSKLEQFYKIQLKSIRIKLYGKE